MTTSWPTLPYMSSDGVGRASIAAGATFGQIYRAVRPRHVLLPWCGPCSGLECVDPSLTTRVVGVDADIQYVAVARQRYRLLAPALEVYCGDPLRVRLQPASDFDLVHLAFRDGRGDALALARAAP